MENTIIEAIGNMRVTYLKYKRTIKELRELKSIMRAIIIPKPFYFLRK